MKKAELLDLIESARKDGLTRMDLSGKNIKELPAEIGNLVKLTALNLKGNQLTEIPAEIGNLQKLSWLDLGGNQLTALPPAIGDLKKLTTLNCPENKLTTLPPAIGGLTNLHRLDLEENQLMELPPAIGSLTNLTFLLLKGNQLTMLPSELCNLTNIRKITLLDNPVNVPAEIAEAGMEAILAHLSDRKDKLGERFIVAFKYEVYGQLFPIEHALVRTLGGQYIIEKTSDRIVVSLESPEQLQDALDAVIPALAALEKAAPDEIRSLEVEHRNCAPEKIEGKDVQEYFRKVNYMLDKHLVENNELTFIEKSGVETAKGAPFVGNMLAVWLERFIKR
jgi:Leucine rich repeat